MPLHAYYLPQERLLVTQVKGLLDDESLVAYYRGVCESPQIDLDVPELVDLTEISLLSPVGKDGYQRVSEIVKATYGEDAEPAAAASVAPNLFVFGMMRMYELGFAPKATNVRVFQSFASALTWLERDPALESVVRALEPGHESYRPELAVLGDE